MNNSLVLAAESPIDLFIRGPLVSGETAHASVTFMSGITRPRWHDAMIVTAILGVLVVGVCALWWDGVRGVLGLESGSGSAKPSAAIAPGKV